MSVTVRIDDKEVTFEVVREGEGVSLKATHIDGVEKYCGYLLTITAEGKFKRETGVSNCWPFVTNSDGQIKQVKEA
jgi:hypothetical protein